MNLTILRDVFGVDTTLSRLFVTYDGKSAYARNGWRKTNPRGPLEFGYVLEDEDRGLEKDDPAGCVKLKVKTDTAIPAGLRYIVKRTPSPKFGHMTADGKMMEILKVPAFVGIRLHPGWRESHTDGCPLLSLSRDIESMTLGRSTSNTAWAWLDDRARECEARGEEVTLDIIRDAAAWPAFHNRTR